VFSFSILQEGKCAFFSAHDGPNSDASKADVGACEGSSFGLMYAKIEQAAARTELRQAI
jgi:hypothetical protein